MDKGKLEVVVAIHRKTVYFVLFSFAWFSIERENVREVEIYSASRSYSTLLVAMSTASPYRKDRQPCRPNFPYVGASSQFHWMRLTDEGSIPRDSSRVHFDGGKIVIKPVYFDLGELKKRKKKEKTSGGKS